MLITYTADNIYSTSLNRFLKINVDEVMTSSKFKQNIRVNPFYPLNPWPKDAEGITKISE